MSEKGACKAVIFDLDGVLVTTDDYHYKAWKKMADEEGIDFDRKINERLRGVSRMESLAIILEKSSHTYTDSEKTELAGRKNAYYRDSLKSLSPSDILPGTKETLAALKKRHIKVAVGSSSKNAIPILEKIGMKDSFDAIADGNDITNSKPDPEVFLVAAKKLGLKPADCVVVEDAEAGLEAAYAAGMRCFAVGSAASSPKAKSKAVDLSQADFNELIDPKF
ncbi:MAG: beta-phosphoglucomutase [Treponemataceae bacterium]